MAASGKDRMAAAVHGLGPRPSAVLGRTDRTAWSESSGCHVGTTSTLAATGAGTKT